MPVVREYETMCAERTPENSFGPHKLTPGKFGYLSEKERGKGGAGREVSRYLYQVSGQRFTRTAPWTLR